MMQPIAATLILSLLLAAIALPVILWQKHILTRRWQTLADRLNLTYSSRSFNQMVAGGPALNKFAQFLFQQQPQLTGIYRDRPIAIGVAFADLLHNEPIYRERLDHHIDPSDRPLREHTTLRIAIQTQLPHHYHCICAKPSPLLAKTTGDLLTVAKHTGLPAIKTGDHPLDRHFRIQTRLNTPAQRFLIAPDIRKILLNWRPRKPTTEFGARSYGIELKESWLLYEEHRPSQFFAERGIPETLTMMLQLVDGLESASSQLE